jgi:hypothetical protein
MTWEAVQLVEEARRTGVTGDAAQQIGKVDQERHTTGRLNFTHIILRSQCETGNCSCNVLKVS